MKKFFSFGLSIFLLFGLFVGGALGAYYDEHSGKSWEDAYIIDSVEDWQSMIWLNHGANDEKKNKYYKLAADLDLTNLSNVRIADFDGHFDGQNHTLKISSDNSLFGIIYRTVGISYDADPTIKNLNVNGIIRCNEKFQTMGGIIERSSFSVENLSFSGSIYVEGNTADPFNWIGGVIGEANGNVKNCKFSGTIHVRNNVITGLAVGGIAGRTTASIENCETLYGSEILSTHNAHDANTPLNEKRSFAGGIAGMSTAGMSTAIKNCISQASVSGADFNGGIVGVIDKTLLSNNTWPANLPQIGFNPDTNPTSGDVSQDVQPQPVSPDVSPDIKPQPESPDVNPDIPPTSPDTSSDIKPQPESPDVSPDIPPVNPISQDPEPIISDDKPVPGPVGPVNPEPEPEPVISDDESPSTTIIPISDELRENIREKISQSTSHGINEIYFVETENIGVPREPNDAMEREAIENGMQFVLNLNTISFNENGYYLFMLNLEDEFEDNNFEDLKLYFSTNNEFSNSRAAFSPVSTNDIYDLRGNKIPNLAEKVLIGISGIAGESYSMWILEESSLNNNTQIHKSSSGGGCNSSLFNALPVLFIFIMRKHSRKH